MRGFFQQIRKSMVRKSNFRKYVFYAIGEILLVVIGILIALQINNWNEKQKNKKEELITLKNLKVELSQNLEQLNFKIEGVKSVINGDSLLIQNMNTDVFEKTQDSLGQMLHWISSPITYDPSDGVINDIINSGKINLISNDELRLSITSWDRNLNEAKEIEKFLEQLSFDQLRPYLLDKASNRNAYSNQIGESPFSWKPSEVMKDKVFENLLVRSTEFFTILKSRYDYLKLEILKMLSIIDEVIED